MTGDLSHIKEKKSEGRKILGKKRKNRGYGKPMQAKGAKRLKI
jgi:hypothetical protein